MRAQSARRSRRPRRANAPSRRCSRSLFPSLRDGLFAVGACLYSMAARAQTRPAPGAFIALRTLQMNDVCLKSLNVGTGIAARQIAVRRRDGAAAGLFWLGGFKSDMRGTKAEALDRWAQSNGRAMTRFDYSGHGESGGNFTEGTIGRWFEETLAVFEAFCREPQIVIGSSMGGWLPLLPSRQLTARTPADPRVTRLVLIAPEVDFTVELVWKLCPAEVYRDDRY